MLIADHSNLATVVVPCLLSFSLNVAVVADLESFCVVVVAVAVVGSPSSDMVHTGNVLTIKYFTRFLVSFDIFFVALSMIAVIKPLNKKLILNLSLVAEDFSQHIIITSSLGATADY